ncbi:aminopeptidase N [Vibrio salinus]|uniref:aminopeptidase N n=1 Tax=Vibrio salinus TaxID=2899784 RepID=UPI001E4538A3|nr:aminopeptidase N [Vibrio salinus]MCE0492558.1 aminopeptidase N [Vibrio salinus]
MANVPQAKYRKDYQRPTHTITDINLTFHLDASVTQVTAVSSVKQQGDDNTLVLDGDNLVLKSVTVNGAEWEHYQESEGHLILTKLPDVFELSIVTTIDPLNNTALEGLYISDGAFCTQCEAEGFRRITYYLDRPDVLARFITTIIADKTRYPYLLSNGNMVEKGQTDDGKHWVTWKDPHPKPAYLFALVAGDFDVLRDQFTTRSGRDVALEIFVDKGNLERSHHAMVSLKNAMKWDEERFGLEYDLDIYMIVAVDFFNMGAMENKGLNVFNSKYVLANDQTATDSDYLGIESVIGHEYFHNWTGNRVTCRDWFQLSLKEGLTVFRDQEFSSDLGSRVVNRIHNVRIIRGPQFAEDASPMSHPIRPEKVIEMNNFYTLTVYEKGSEVIRMIHTLLGEENFQKGMRLYFERHDGTAATCEDFVSAMEDASGVDLAHFRHWYSQSGTPVLDVEGTYNDVEKTYTLKVKQQTNPTVDQPEKCALHIPLDVELYAPDGTIIPLQCNGKKIANVLNIKESEQVFVFDNVESKPVPSLLREFSAPVRLNFSYTDDELSFLIVNATNDFARWDAGQMLLAKHIRSNISRVEKGQDVIWPESIITAFKGVLTNDSLEAAFIAEMLTLPGLSEVFGWYEQIDIDYIDTVLTSLKKTLASELKEAFAQCYQALFLPEYTTDHGSIGKRALKNVCLLYLAYTEDGDALVNEQYRTSNNMTDTIAAMTAANHAELPCREPLMESYSEHWKHDGLVMDKWFILQGSSPSESALSVVKQCMNHDAFSMKNPNRIRSLIGSFMNQNPSQFHKKDGSGYRFALDILKQLNVSNPQVAARLIDPLLKFKHYDVARQELIRSVLEELHTMQGLAKDLYEKVSKALES